MGSPRATSSAHTLDDDELPEHECIDHLLVLYATETGNSQDVAERLGREVRRRGGKCVLMSMDTFDVVRPSASCIYSRTESFAMTGTHVQDCTS